VKFTRYSLEIRKRADRVIIVDEWLECAIADPFREGTMAETGDLDENTVLDVDAAGNLCAITVEHASDRTGIPEFSYEQIPT